MDIELRYFASLRETLNVSWERVDLPDTIITVNHLRTYLRRRSEIWNVALSDERLLRVAINQQIASADTMLTKGAEVAFFPPVTGG